MTLYRFLIILLVHRVAILQFCTGGVVVEIVTNSKKMFHLNTRDVFIATNLES